MLTERYIFLSFFVNVVKAHSQKKKNRAHLDEIELSHTRILRKYDCPPANAILRKRFTLYKLKSKRKHPVSVFIRQVIR